MGTLKKALVIGGVNLDVKAQCGASVYARRLDSPEDIEYSIGGCAYKVAWNLSSNQALTDEPALTVTLLSALDEDSLDGFALLNKIASSDFSYKSLGRTMVSGGYVVHKQTDPGSTKAITQHVPSSASLSMTPGSRLKLQMLTSSTPILTYRLMCFPRLFPSVLYRLNPLVIGVASDDKAARVSEAISPPLSAPGSLPVPPHPLGR